MGATGLAELVTEVREASQALDQSDRRTQQRIDGLENSFNTLMRKVGRPPSEAANDNEV